MHDNTPSLSTDPDASGDGLKRLSQVRVELSVEIGRVTMSLGEALALGPGSVVAVERLADQPVDLLVNGKLVARGEVVVIDAEYGLRVTEVVGAQAGLEAGASGEVPQPVVAAVPEQPVGGVDDASDTPLAA